MTQLLQHLIEALREELKQYGEMLALLEHQQELVIHRHAPELLQSVSAINSQAEKLHAVRREREQRRRCVAIQVNAAEDAPFVVLIPLMPAEYRPLLEALVQENNDLLVRVQKRARQNHLLLSRAVDLMQRFMSSLFPGANPGTYNDTGHVLAGSAHPHALYDAVG